jgi:serine/threonine protein kinase
MEYIRGRSVQDIVDDDGPLSCERAARFTYEAALGLAAAHKHGLIHRDVKPANLLVEDEKLVRLTDFGLARAAGEEEADAASLTMQHDEKVLGTADYIAPEQAINSHAIDARADLYSLGYTLYFMLTGQPPFPTGRIVERLTKHCTQEPESISTFRSDVPESLLAIVNKMTRKRADERYSSADAVAEALSDWLAQPDAPSHGASVAAKWVRQSAAPARPSSAVLSGSSIDDDELDLAPEDEKGVTAAASKPAATLTTAKTDRPLLPELSSKALVDDVQLQPLMGGLDELLDELPQALPCFAGSSSDVHGSDAQTHEIEQSRVDIAAGSTLPSRVDLQQKRDSSALGRFYGEMKRGEYPLWLLIGAGLIMGAVAMLVVWSYVSSNEQVDLPAYKRLEP